MMVGGPQGKTMQLGTWTFSQELAPVAVGPVMPPVRYTVKEVWGGSGTAAARLRLPEPTRGLEVEGCFLFLRGRVYLTNPTPGPVKLRFLCCHTPLAVFDASPAERNGEYWVKCHLSVFGLPRDAAIEVVVEHPGGVFHGATIVLSLTYPLAPQVQYTPLLINGLPRSGTTWLMSLLSAHPEIVAAGGYPFEQSHGIYWSLASRVLSQPDLEIHRLRGMQNYTFTVPPSPFNPGTFDTAFPWFAEEYPQHLAASVRSFTDGFYRRESQLQGRERTSVFVEKWPGRIVPHTMRWIFPRVREIFLLRHPRDVILSILRFNARRGFADFGVESYGTGREFIASVARQLREDLKLFRERTADGSGVILDYHRLRRNTEGELARMLVDFDLRSDAAAIRSMIETTRHRDMSAHVTSDGSGGQIELSPEQECWIGEEFADYFYEFPAAA